MRVDPRVCQPPDVPGRDVCLLGEFLRWLHTVRHVRVLQVDHPVRVPWLGEQYLQLIRVALEPEARPWHL